MLRRVHRYGGDPSCVHLVAQSAGGQLGALALIRQAERCAAERGASSANSGGGQPMAAACVGALPAWRPTALAGFMGGWPPPPTHTLYPHPHTLRPALWPSLPSRTFSLNACPLLCGSYTCDYVMPAPACVGWHMNIYQQGFYQHTHHHHHTIILT